MSMLLAPYTGTPLIFGSVADRLTALALHPALPAGLRRELTVAALEALRLDALVRSWTLPQPN